MLNINKEIVSFQEIPLITQHAEKSVLLVRHSFRESLENGNLDPGLTVKGWEYAVECGKYLKGIKDIALGSSPRKRTIQTIQALVKGGELGEELPIVPYNALHDTAMFSPPEELYSAIENKTLPQLLKTYYSTGNASGMIGKKEFANSLLDFLTGTQFGKKNVLLASHDILLITLLLHFQVYPFRENDWFGYVQGVFLWQDQEGVWTISYAVPDKNNRELCQLFV